MKEIKFKVWNKTQKKWVTEPNGNFQVGWVFNTDTSEFSVRAYATGNDIRFIPILQEGKKPVEYSTSQDMVIRKQQATIRRLEKAISAIPKQKSWDEKEIKEIIEVNFLYLNHQEINQHEICNKTISQLSALQPSGEVIAEGKVKAYPSGIEIGNTTLSQANDKVINHCGHKIKLMIHKYKENSED